MFLNMMQDWAGWLLILFSFSIVLIWKHLRSDTKVVHAIWFCTVMHHVVVFLNVYIPDASTFQNAGLRLASLPEPELLSDFSNGAINYIHFLGFFYRAFFSASHLFGKELSVLAFVLSCVVLVKLVYILDLRRFRVGIVLFFGLLPSKVIFGSVTLREPWQALFFLLFVYSAIRLQNRLGILNVSLLLMSSFCMSLLHHGLAKYAVYLFLISIFWCVFGSKRSVRWVRNVRFLFAGLLVAFTIILIQKMGLFMTIGEAFEEAADMRRSLMRYEGTRTAYGFELDTSSVIGLVNTISICFVQYMFAPFPWQVGNVKDIWALLESILRFLLLFFAISSWWRSSGEVRSRYSFLLLAVLGMEFVWALGTVNWGTAIRHHMPGYSVIVLLGAPGLILFMRRLQFGIFRIRKDSGELNEQSLHMS